MARRAGHKELQPCSLAGNRGFILDLIFLPVLKLCPFPRKQANKPLRKAYICTPSEIWQVPSILCTEVPPHCGRMSKLCLHDPEIRRWEDNEVSLTLTWGALKKVHVHSPKYKHVYTDFGPLACAALKVHTLT